VTTEYYLQEGDVQADVARDLLEQAEHPDQVHWSPRPDVYGGGVYVLGDESIAQRTLAVRKARRQEEADRIAANLAAADERDSHEAVASGLATPGEAGFPANTGTDPGSGAEGAASDDAQAEGDEAVTTEDEGAEETDDDGKPLTPAQKRARTRAARQQAEADKAAADEAAANEEKSE
jgi:hypothetical protein